MTVSGNNSLGFNGSNTQSYTLSENQVASFMGVDFGVGTLAPLQRFHVDDGNFMVRDDDPETTKPTQGNWDLEFGNTGYNTVGSASGYASIGFFARHSTSGNYEYTTIFHETFGSSPAQARLHLGGVTNTAYVNILTVDIEDENVGIGTETPNSSYKLEVNGDVLGDVFDTSDLRLKTNINIIETPLDKIKNVRGVVFDWKDPIKPISHSKTIQTTNGIESIEMGGRLVSQEIGFIAQELKEVVPEVVRKDDNGFFAVKYSAITALNLEGIKQLASENEQLREEVETLKFQIQQLMETVYSK